MTRGLRITFYVICIFLFLAGTGYFAIISVLRNNGITFSEKDFDFPLRLKVKNIRIDIPDFKATIEYFEIDLNPGKLLSKRIDGDYLRLKNGVIEIASTDTTEASSNINLKDLPHIRFNTILLSNIKLKSIIDKDTLLVNVPEFYISNLNLCKIWQIDTLHNDGTSIAWISNNEKSEDIKKSDATSSKENFLFPDIPEFKIKNVVFNDCNFEVHSGKQHHSFTNFNIALNSEKDSENISMSVNNFSLTYQDTLNVELTLNKILINKKEEVKMSNLAFDLPGLKLRIPQLDISNPGTPRAEIKIASSAINTSLVKFVSPQTKLPLTKDAELEFNGDVVIANNTCSFKNLAITIDDKSTFIANGHADLSGKNGSGADIKITKLRTHTNALTDLFGLQLAANQKEIAIKSDIHLYGQYDYLKADGNLTLNQNKTRFNTILDLRNKQKTAINFNLYSNLFDSQQLFDTTMGLVMLRDLKLESKTILNSNDEISGIALKIESKSLRINEYTISIPAVNINYTPEQASASINFPDILKLTLRSSDNVLGNEINYSGTLQSTIPQYNDLKVKAGELYSEFNGQYKRSDAAMSFIMELETITLNTIRNGNEYSGNGQLSFAKAKSGDLLSNLIMNGEEIITLKTTGEFSEWWAKKNKWTGEYPETEIIAAFSLDSTLVYDLTGRRGMIQLDNLEVKAGGNAMSIEIEIPTLFITTLQLKDLKLGFESNQNTIDGELTIQKFENPYTILEDVNLLLIQKNEHTAELSFNTFLPEVNHGIEINTTITHEKDVYQINLNEKALILGEQIWNHQQSDGFLFDENLKLISGDLTVTNGFQKVNVETYGETIILNIDTLQLHPIWELITNDTSMKGDLNLYAAYHVNDESIQWKGSVNAIEYNNQKLGAFNFDGDFNKDLHTHFSIHEKYGDFDLLLNKEDSSVNYNFKVRDLDLAYISEAISRKDLGTISGNLHASIKGAIGKEITSDGFIHFDQFESYLTENKIYLKVEDDTLWFKDQDIIAENFRIYDKANHELKVDGKYTLKENPEINLTIRSNEFTVLDSKVSKNKIKGLVAISSDLTVIRTLEKFEIKGDLNVLPNSSLSYLYESSVSLDEREKEITFTSFKELDNPENDTIRTRLKRREKPIEWDVRLGVGKSDISILLSETYQDNIKMTARGDFLLKTGSTDEPFFFGSLKSNEGNIVYDAPMVSDVDLQIENLLVTWNGELSRPRLTFLGSELFRIVPKGVPGMTNTTSTVPVTVLVKVKDKPISDFELAFDLNSTDAKMKSWIQSLPEDTREESAINLLLFGSLNFGGTGSSGYMQSIAAKMNELSRRNIKSADLTFYTESENVSETTSETKEKLGYNISRGLFNKNVKVSFGGTLDFGNSPQATDKKSSALTNLQLEYILSQSPDVSLTLAQKTIYDGIINGEVGESSIGVTYLKRFRNFFKRPEKNEIE